MTLFLITLLSVYTKTTQKQIKNNKKTNFVWSSIFPVIGNGYF